MLQFFFTKGTLTIKIPIITICNEMLIIMLWIRYVIRLMEWIDDMITDEKIFPPVDDVPFPRYLTNVLLYVHIYNVIYVIHDI